MLLQYMIFSEFIELNKFSQSVGYTISSTFKYFNLFFYILLSTNTDCFTKFIIISPLSPDLSPAQSQASLSIRASTSNLGREGLGFTLNSPSICLIISPIKWN